MATATNATTEQRWKGVADAINERMDELGWEQIDLSRAAGVSDATVRKLQHANATRYHRSTLAKVARALGWPSDGIWTILTTGDVPDAVGPRAIRESADDDTDLIETVADLRYKLADLEARLRRRAQSG